MKLSVFVCISLCLWTTSVLAATDKVVCYYGSWSVYRQGNGKFTVEDINPTLCTHLIYGFVGLSASDGSVIVLDPQEEEVNQGFKRFNALKSSNPSLKTSVAVGGWNEGSEKYSAMAANPTLRANFIRTAVELISTYGFDGFDLDWEYPAQRGGSDADKANYVTLLSEFRQEFDKHGYLLSAAVAATGTAADLSYDVPSLSKYLDFINVMTYDFHGSWDAVTGQNAPLYPSSADVTEAQKLLNIDASINDWLARGADPAKLILGTGAYGRTFSLASTSSTGIGAETWGAGNAGPYTSQAGMLGYNEICELQLAGGWTVVYDNEQQVPYAYKGNQWVGYDNAQSEATKVEYAKKRGLGGMMIWSVDTEDFRGLCGTKYPLLKAINTALGKDFTEDEQENEPIAPENPSTSAPAPPSSPENGDLASNCKENGYIPYPNDCSKFLYCLYYDNKYVVYEFACSNGLYYDKNTGNCNYAELVEC